MSAGRAQQATNGTIDRSLHRLAFPLLLSLPLLACNRPPTAAPAAADTASKAADIAPQTSTPTASPSPPPAKEEPIMASAEWNTEPAPIPPPAPGTVRFYASSSGGSSSRNLWVTGNSTNFRFDGSTWTPFHLPGRVQVGNRIAVVSDKSAWMVGNYGTVARFDGTSWTTQKLDRVDYDLKYVAAHGDKVWISGSRGTLLHFDGRGWSNIAIPGLADFHLGDVFAANPSNIHVVACRKYDEVPTLARFDGTSWTTLKAGKPGCFKRLHGTAPDDIWAVGFEKRRAGDAGQAMHFDGTRWVDMPLPSDALINDVSAVSRSLAWAVGGRGTILRWDGRAWAKSESGVTSELTAVFAPSDGPAVAAGMQILRHK